MKLLAIDTSSAYLSLAILKDEKILAKFHKKADMRHSILLVPMIDKLLKKVRLKIKDIDCFAVSIGPGSFTGLRIGVTVVKGMAFALKKRIVVVPTLDVIANNGKAHKGIVCPVLDARKNKVYACLYRSDGKTVKRISKYMLLPLADLLNKTKKYDRVLFLDEASHPRAEIAARLGAKDFEKNKFVKPEDLEPMYLYSNECDITGK